MQKVLLIAAAGAVGSLARYWLSGFVQEVVGIGFPWGTFAVNVLGSFLFGLVWTLSEERLLISPDARVMILTGFMGAFTTFSTFMFETGGFIRDSQWLLAAGNVVSQVVVGVICVFLGMAAGRLF